MKRTLAHLSDLHFGHSEAMRRACVAARDSVIEQGIDHVVVTGDLTERGRFAELDDFYRVFGPLIAARRVTVIPGNHDRLGDDLGRHIMGSGRRVDVETRAGLHLIRVDSTGPHNRRLIRGHGALCDRVLAEIDEALDGAAPDALRVVLLHHHVFKLPEETFWERIATRLGWPFALELPLGRALVDRVSGRCDLILHGHRHVPRAWFFEGRGRDLGVYNAGSTPSLGRVRVFSHAAGMLLHEPHWLSISEDNDDRRARPRAVRTVRNWPAPARLPAGIAQASPA